MDRDLGRRWCSGRRGGTALGTGRRRGAGRGRSHWDRVVIGGGLIDFVRVGPESSSVSSASSAVLVVAGFVDDRCLGLGLRRRLRLGSGSGSGSGSARARAPALRAPARRSADRQALRGRSPPARERPSTGRSSVLRHSWRAARMVRVWAAARAPVYPSRPTAHDVLLRIADRRHKEAGHAGAGADEAEQEEHEGHARSTRRGRHRPRRRPPSSRRRARSGSPTTRPIRADGVRSWNSAWLGMMNTMFAIPSPTPRPSTTPRLPDTENRIMTRPVDDVAGADHRTFREPRPDQADDEPAEQVADADARLEEGVDRARVEVVVGEDDEGVDGHQRGQHADRCLARPSPGWCWRTASPRCGGTDSRPSARQ